MYLVMPDAIHLEQPGCRVAASRHFRASGVWDMAPAQRPLRARALQRAGTSISVQAEVTCVCCLCCCSFLAVMKRAGRLLGCSPPHCAACLM